MNPILRCKFVVSEVTKRFQGNGQFSEVVKMRPVWGSTEENKAWSKATPSGELWFDISNPGAQGRMVVGAEYYVDLTSALAPDSVTS
jgi:hypothetical protein